MLAPPQIARSPASEFLAGTIAALPIIIAAAPIGLLFGAVAAQKGLSSLEIAIMSATVFAGGSQFVAIDLWHDPVAVIAIAFSALLVNIRHVLMSASIAPKLAAFSTIRRYLACFFLADEIWALSEKHALHTALTPAWYSGLVLPFYLGWVASTTAGSVAGAIMGDPARLGFDFAFPAVFVCLIMSFWKGAGTGAILLASAVTAALTHHFIEGAWYIAAGALTGVIVAALTADIDEDDSLGKPAEFSQEQP